MLIVDLFHNFNLSWAPLAERQPRAALLGRWEDRLASLAPLTPVSPCPRLFTLLFRAVELRHRLLSSLQVCYLEPFVAHPRATFWPLMGHSSVISILWWFYAIYYRSSAFGSEQADQHTSI